MLKSIYQGHPPASLKQIVSWAVPHRLLNEEQRQDIEQMFAMQEKGADGCVQLDALLAQMREVLGHAIPPDIVAEVDRNGDHRVSHDEFKRFYAEQLLQTSI